MALHLLPHIPFLHFETLYGDPWRLSPSFHVLALFIHVLCIFHNTHCWVLCFMNVWKPRHFRFLIFSHLEQHPSMGYTFSMLQQPFSFLWSFSNLVLFLNSVECMCLFCLCLIYILGVCVLGWAMFMLNVCSLAVRNSWMYPLLNCVLKLVCNLRLVGYVVVHWEWTKVLILWPMISGIVFESRS